MHVPEARVAEHLRGGGVGDTAKNNGSDRVDGRMTWDQLWAGQRGRGKQVGDISLVMGVVQSLSEGLKVLTLIVYQRSKARTVPAQYLAH